jgi:hypothetical protein
VTIPSTFISTHFTGKATQVVKSYSFTLSNTYYGGYTHAIGYKYFKWDFYLIKSQMSIYSFTSSNTLDLQLSFNPGGTLYELVIAIIAVGNSINSVISCGFFAVPLSPMGYSPGTI